MDNLRWEQLKDLLNQALERPPESRTEFIREMASDPDLASEVMELVRAHDSSEGFLEVPFSDQVLERSLPERLGPYRVLQEIGRGGMGTVLLAVRDDDEYQKRVAVKLAGGTLAADAGRFRRERQILANLEHPYIARLLDGGTTENGSPYVVLEYVDGLPIDEYSRRRELDVRGIIRLFLEVCEAVQYAHRNLVVHRDLKPANILIAADGKPRLLDFGIARLLEETGVENDTRPMVRILTPEFASPEQVRGEPVTVSSDVYSLGVLLYRLLVGKPPYSVPETPAEMERVICTQEPIRPSFAVDRPVKSKQLRGDLDNILLKALRKEADRRYASVEQFAEDLERHLGDLPVLARPDTLGYRLGKFIRRHRAGAAAAAAMVALLFGGLGATLWQARAAERERQKAERRFEEVRQLANSFIFEFNDAIQPLPGSTPARQLVVSRGLQYLDRLAGEAAGDPNLQKELGLAYLRLGDVQGNPFGPNLGDIQGSRRSYARAEELLRLAGSAPGHESTRVDLAGTLDRIGEVLAVNGDYEAALAKHREALQIREEQSAQSPQRVELRYQVASGLQRIGEVLFWTGRAEEAASIQARSAQMFFSISEQEPGDRRYTRAVAVAYLKTGDLKASRAEHEDARDSYARAVGVFEQLSQAAPGEAPAGRDLASGLKKLAGAELALGRLDAALKAYSRALEANQRTADLDPSSEQARRDLAVTLGMLGQAQEQAGQDRQAIESYQRALQLFEELAGPTDAAGPRRDLALIYSTLGDFHWGRKVPVTARRWYRRALDEYSRLESLHGLRPGDREEVGRIQPRVSDTQ